jgi:hypothetical protein
LPIAVKKIKDNPLLQFIIIGLEISMGKMDSIPREIKGNQPIY